MVPHTHYNLMRFLGHPHTAYWGEDGKDLDLPPAKWSLQDGVGKEIYLNRAGAELVKLSR